MLRTPVGPRTIALSQTPSTKPCTSFIPCLLKAYNTTLIVHSETITLITLPLKSQVAFLEDYSNHYALLHGKYLTTFS